MPKSVKPAPPQQSSLAEMWGGKKNQKQKSDASKVDENAMDVAKVEEIKGTLVFGVLIAGK
jgi:DNA ligase-1